VRALFLQPQEIKEHPASAVTALRIDVEVHRHRLFARM
jgi:hypothetical protein